MKSLLQAIGAPPHVRSLILTLEAGKPCTARIEYYPTDEEGKFIISDAADRRLGLVIGEYTLIRTKTFLALPEWVQAAERAHHGE